MKGLGIWVVGFEAGEYFWNLVDPDHAKVRSFLSISCFVIGLSVRILG